MTMTVMWSTISALFVLALWGMQSLLSHRNAAFAAWQWVAYVVWLLWTLAGVALVWTFADERESRPIKVSALIFGGVSAVAAIAMALFWILP